jgi:hypothetical protein
LCGEEEILAEAQRLVSVGLVEGYDVGNGLDLGADRQWRTARALAHWLVALPQVTNSGAIPV